MVPIKPEGEARVIYMAVKIILTVKRRRERKKEEKVILSRVGILHLLEISFASQTKIELDVQGDPHCGMLRPS